MYTFTMYIHIHVLHITQMNISIYQDLYTPLYIYIYLHNGQLYIYIYVRNLKYKLNININIYNCK